MDFFDCNLCVTDIVLACKVPGGTGDKVHNDRPSHGLAFNADGRKTYSFNNGKEFTVKKNHIIFLPQNSSYTVEDDEQGDCFAINFKLSETIELPPFAMNIKNSGKMLEAFRAAEKSFRVKNEGYTAECMSSLYAVISMLYREKNTAYISGSLKETILPAIRHIHNNYTDKNIKAEDLARLCGVSETYFRRIFKKCCAVPPIQYINNLRLTRAKELLAEGTASLEIVSEMCGFGEVCYFCRFFKKAVGKTPSEYRKCPD